MPTRKPLAVPPLPFAAADFRHALLTWYAAHARPLPWRATQNPYAIWLAETMLQQTTVATVVPYWQRFLAAFPTVEQLAAAPTEQVLHLWQGLGYYRRAHLLHACAKQVVHTHGGRFPGTEAELLTLPGIGPYSAAAIAATAFNQPASVLDGNVERVVGRLFRLQAALPAAKPTYRALAARLACPTQPRAYANAIMELGATVCTPKNPACPNCPVQAFCAAKLAGDATTYPRKTKPKKLPTHTARAYVLTTPGGHLYLAPRPTTGMLAGLFEVPCTSPVAMPLGWPSTLHFNIPNPVMRGDIKHTFSHFHLVVQVFSAPAPTNIPAPWQAYAADNLPPTSTLMRKILSRAAQPLGQANI